MKFSETLSEHEGLDRIKLNCLRLISVIFMVHRTWRLLQLRSGEGSGNKVSNFDANRLRRFSFLFFSFLGWLFSGLSTLLFGWGVGRFYHFTTALQHRTCAYLGGRLLWRSRIRFEWPVRRTVIAPMEKRERKQFDLKLENSLKSVITKCFHSFSIQRNKLMDYSRTSILSFQYLATQQQLFRHLQLSKSSVTFLPDNPSSGSVKNSGRIVVFSG